LAYCDVMAVNDNFDKVLPKKRDNWHPAEVGDGTRDTRAKNRDVPPKAGRVATLEIACTSSYV